MKTNLDRRSFLALGGLLPASAALAQGSSPRWQDTPPRERIRRRHFPDVVLQTHQGRQARFYEDLIRDKIVLINFMYVNCSDGGCPLTTHVLDKVQRLLAPRVGKDIFMYSITLDPERDTLADLRKYARTHHAGPGWLYLRASAPDTERLRRSLGFYDRDPEVDRDKASHASMIRYGNEPLQLWAMSSSLVPPAAIASAVGWVAPPPARRRPQGQLSA